MRVLLRLRCVAVVGVTTVLLAAVPGATCALAQGYSMEHQLGSAAQSRPAYLAHAGLEQRLGEKLPLSVPYTDSTGRSGPLGSWFQGRPVVFAEVYYKCAMLCPQVLHGLATGLAQTTLQPGKDYDVIVMSIDPSDTPAEAVPQKQQFVQEAGWANNPTAAHAVHFLTGPKSSIEAVSAATGFHYVMVPGPDGKMDQFAHSSVIMFATAEGQMSKYLAGIDYPARDLRLALLDASHKKISNPVDLLILYCCSYSPQAGTYSVSIMRILGLAAMVTILIVIGMVYLLTRKPASQREPKGSAS